MEVIKMKRYLTGLFYSLLLLPCFANAGGLERVNSFMESIQDLLSGAAVISVTVAIMFAGYKFLFANANAMEAGKIVIAGLFIGGAAEIAGYLVG